MVSWRRRGQRNGHLALIRGSFDPTYTVNTPGSSIPQVKHVAALPCAYHQFSTTMLYDELCATAGYCLTGGIGPSLPRNLSGFRPNSLSLQDSIFRLDFTFSRAESDATIMAGGEILDPTRCLHTQDGR